MALCQLTRYDEAASDYARAVELDPENEQLNISLSLCRTISLCRKLAMKRHWPRWPSLTLP